jgi:hypothetical protein
MVAASRSSPSELATDQATAFRLLVLASIACAGVELLRAEALHSGPDGLLAIALIANAIGLSALAWRGSRTSSWATSTKVAGSGILALAVVCAWVFPDRPAVALVPLIAFAVGLPSV